MIYSPIKFLLSDRQKDDPKLYQALSHIDDVLVQLAGGGSGNIGNIVSKAIDDFTSFVTNLDLNNVHWNQLDFTLFQSAPHILGIQNVPIADLLAGTVNFAGGTTVFQSNGAGTPRLVLASGVIYMDEGAGVYPVEINPTGISFGAGRYQGGINNLGVSFTDSVTGFETLVSAGAISLGKVGGGHINLSSSQSVFDYAGVGIVADGTHVSIGSSGFGELVTNPLGVDVTGTITQNSIPVAIASVFDISSLSNCVAVGNGGTGHGTAAGGLAALGGVDAAGVTAQINSTVTYPFVHALGLALAGGGAHTMTIPKLTAGGANGSITWNIDGCVSAWVNPT